MDENELLINIIKKYNLQKGQYIDYPFFLMLYKECDNRITEREFASLLGMTKSKYKNLRNYNGRASILKNIELSLEEKQEILNALIKKYGLQKGEFISYEIKDETIKYTFREMYDEYKSTLTEYEFAKLLGIENLRNIRRKIKDNDPKIHKARILMNQNSTEEEKQKIFEERIRKEPFYREGKKITYQELKAMYQPYKAMLMEFEFAELLGIGYKYYYTMRTIDEKDAYIRDYIVLKKARDIKEKIEERFYSIEEIECICEDYGITKEQFIIYILQNGKFYDPQVYLNSLMQNKRLWLKSTKMSNSFVEKNYDVLLQKIKMQVRKMCYKYDMEYYKEELTSQAVTYMYTKCGDIEKNFTTDEDNLNRILYLRMQLYVRGECLKKKTEDKKTQSLYEEKIGIDKDGKMPIERIKVKTNVTPDEEKEIFTWAKLIEEIQLGKNKGYTRDTIIRLIIEKYDINPDEIIKLLDEQLKNREQKKEIER